ncbi:hypothetical protein PV433_20750 [Paenibacillus sp. GYB004]|uniref:hypothetical protein n=1 Tax=Paenibacillus sp. GYB004 TaxID=2994393 RepID=UPI002F96479F
MSVKLTRKEDGVQYYGFTISPNHYFWRNQMSLNLVDAQTLQVSLTNDNVKSLMNNIARFYQIPGFNPDKDSLTKMFFKEQVSAMWTPVAGLHVEKDLAPAQLGYCLVPDDERLRATALSGLHFPEHRQQIQGGDGLFVHRDVSDGEGKGGDVHPGAEQR